MRRIFILIIVLIAAYEAFQLDQGLKQKQALTAQLNEIINEKGSIQVQLKESKDTVSLLGQELTGLQKSLQRKETEKLELQKQIEDVQESARDFSEKLLAAKANIEKINKELKLTQNKKEALEKINAKLNISLKDLAEKLKLARSSHDDKAIILSESKLTQLLKAWDEKEQKFAVLEKQLKEMTKKYDVLSGQNYAQTNKQLSEQAKLVASLEKSLKLLGGSLTQKELELRDRIKEVLTLKNEIFTLQARLGSLEKELDLARDEQQRAREDFDALSRVNISLQGKLNALSPEPGKEVSDQEKAELLKRKIEVILQNAQN